MHAAFTVLAVLACLGPALLKLSGHPRMRASAQHFGIVWPRYRSIGLLELAAVAGLIAGLRYPAFGITAALGMLGLLLGALTFHRRAGDGLVAAAPALVATLTIAAYLGAAAS